MQPLRVLLVDDSAAFLKSAGDFLSSDARIHVVGAVTNGLDGVRLARDLRPDLVLVDLAMPGMSGIQVARAIKRQAVPPRVVVVTLYDDPENRRLVDGEVDGFISKSAFIESMHELIESLS